MEKRRDNKGRVLRTNEQQRKNGQYMFMYKSIDGKYHYVYSWRLEPTDRIPAGKRQGMSLREMEKQILRDKDIGIVPRGGELTVNEIVRKYVEIVSPGKKKNTRSAYKTNLKRIEESYIGGVRIDKVSISDAKKYLIYLQKDKKLSFSTIHAVRGIIRPAFQMAVDDDIIRKNPFEFRMSEVVYDDTTHRESLSQEEEETFLNFIHDDDHYKVYYDVFYILFNTGLRISEFCGLTIKDIDLEEREIHIDHQLIRGSDMINEIITPKSKAGIRILPMSEGVYNCFYRIIKERKKYKVEPVVRDEKGKAYSRFLILDKNDQPASAQHWQKRMKWALDKYNRSHKKRLPKITPHICRHTYCTKMARAGISPKALQYLMGHADVETTFNVYTHFKSEDARSELVRLNVVAE